MKRLLILCLLVASSRSSARTPRSGFRLDELLPETTLFYAEIDNSSAFRDVFKKTRIYSLLNDEEFKEFIKPAWGAFIDEYEAVAKEFEAAVGVPWDKAWELASDQTAVALVTPGAGKEIQPDFVISVDGAGKAATWRKLVSFLRLRYEKQSGRKAEVWKIGDDEVVSGRFGTDIPFHLCVVGDALVAANQKATMERVVNGRRKGAEKPLARSERFQAAKNRAAPPSSGAAIFLYANVPDLVTAVKARLEDKEKKIVDALGFSCFTYASGAVVPGTDSVAENFYVGVSGERKGLAKFLSLKGPAPDLTMAPPGALEFASLSIDLREVYDTIHEVMKSVDDLEYQRFVESLERFEKDAGVSIKNDILGSFGTRVSGCLVLPEEGLIPDAVTTYEIKDREKLDKTLRVLAKNLDAEIASIDWQGHKIEYLRYNRAAEDPFRMFIGTLYIYRTETHLYATGAGSIMTGTGPGSANALKRMIARKAKGTLADTPELKAWVGGKTGDASAVLYVDFEKAFNLYYNAVAPLLVMFRDALKLAGTDVDLAKLPLAETIGKSLSKSITFVSIDGEGLAITSRSGSGLTLMTAVYGGGLAAIAAPIVARAEVRAKTTKCQTNLFMISYSLRSYQMQKGNAYPDATGADFLKTLTDGAFVTEEYSKCPHSGKAYRGPASDMNKMKDDDPILADDPSSHPDGSIHVLLKNGNVRLVKRDDPLYKKALDGTK